MNTIKRIILIIAVGFLSSCMHSPIPEGYHGPKSIMADSIDNIDSGSAHFYVLLKVDGKPVANASFISANLSSGMGFSLTTRGYKREIAAKATEFEIAAYKQYASDAQSFFGDNYYVSGVVKFTPKEGEIYTIHGQLANHVESVWIQNQDGNLVTTPITKNQNQ